MSITYLLRKVLTPAILPLVLFGILLVFPLTIIGSSQPVSFQQHDELPIHMLTPGMPVTGILTGGKPQVYGMDCLAGQFVKVVVDQKGVDAQITLFTPEGKRILIMNRTINGEETAVFVTETPGIHQVLLSGNRRKSSNSDSYELKLPEMRGATPEEISWFKNFSMAEFLSQDAERLFSVEGKWHEAIAQKQEALATLCLIDDRYGETETLLRIAGMYGFNGEYGKTLDYFEKAWLAAGNNENLHQRILYLWGDTCSTLGKYTEALEKFSQAQALNRGDSYLSWREAEVLTSMGEVYLYQGIYQKALDCLFHAHSLWGETDEVAGEGWALNQIGQVYFALGDYQQSLRYGERSLDKYREGIEREGERFPLTNMAKAYLGLGKLTGNPAYFEKALALLERSLPIWEKSADPRGEPRVKLYQGLAYLGLGHFTQAQGAFQRAVEQFHAINNLFSEATALHHLGQTCVLLQQPEAAHQTLTQALHLRRQIGESRGIAETVYWLSRLELERGNLSQAQQFLEETLELSESVRSSIAEPTLRAMHLANTRDYYELSIDVLMHLQALHPERGYAAQAFQRAEQARARSLFDLLKESQVDLRSGGDPQLIAKEQELETQLTSKFAFQAQLVSKHHKPEQLAELKKEIQAFIENLRQVQAQIRASHPRYAALTQNRIPGLSEMQSVLDRETVLLEYALGQKRSYLWLVTPTTVTGYELPDQATIEALSQQVCELLTLRNQPNQKKSAPSISKADTQFIQVASQLSRILLGPVYSQVKDKRLLIVTEGALQYVPFAALPVPQPISSKENSGNSPLFLSNQTTTTPNHQTKSRENKQPAKSNPVYLPILIEHEIVMLPSLSTLYAIRQEVSGRKSAPKAVCVLADPVFEVTDSRVQPTHTHKNRQSDRTQPERTTSQPGSVLEQSIRDVRLGDDPLKIPRVVASRQESASIMAAIAGFDGKQVLDFEASRATALSSELKQYRIVHFSTHSLVNTVHPELSGIVLSLVDRNGQPQDGFLRLHDIYKMKLPSDLVVLSACQTALGKSVKGEGLIGLTRGFMYAGTPRVVASLWEVNDKATAELMKHFYREMFGNHHLKPGAALRAAQLSMMKQQRWKAPYFWAAFVLQGEYQ
ncbi:MAG: CHAT domain-containing protein [Acidobacteria bacterium]|nr:CHAT domain-containing protein [Acidobacteriota bacterium]